MGAGCGSVDCGVHAADGVGGLIYVLNWKFSYSFFKYMKNTINQTYGGDDRSSQVHSISGKFM